jgi:hypothetical protein
MYSAADYLEMIIIFGECERNAREPARVFEERFPGRNDNYFLHDLYIMGNFTS